MTLFNRDEVYELNEWLREKNGTYEEWIRKRAADRRIEKEAELVDENHQGMQRNS